MKCDIYLVGVGGQGVLTIGAILAEAAMQKGIPVSFYPTKGMAQRGGAVKARLRLGRKLVGPNIAEKGADLVIAMELSEALKAVRFVKPNGDFLLLGRIWAPTAVMLGEADYPTADQVRFEVQQAQGQIHYIGDDSVPLRDGTPVPANVFVLGTAISHTCVGTVLSAVDVAHAIAERWPKDLDRNLFALQAGLDATIGEGQLAPSAQPERQG
jgi:indolepyruvate ferredoxin oxidoreductase beta subunit